MFDYNPAPKRLVSIIPERFHGQISDQLLVCDIQTDSREVSPGALFIALKGIRSDGEKYISNAVENGAVAILVEDQHLATVLKVEVPVIGIENLKDHVSEIAGKFFNFPSNSLNVVGVTGTNGKSTITSLVAQLNALAGTQSGIVGTLGYGLINKELVETGMTTPDIVKSYRIFAELKDAGAKSAAMEVSSHGIHQKRVEDIHFNVAVISNITRDHLDYHGSFEEYAETKKSFLLSSHCDTAVVNVDDKECASIIPRLEKTNKSFVTYGIDNEKAQVKATIEGYSETGISAAVKTPWGNKQIVCPLVGKFNLSNLLAAISACCMSGVNFEKVINGVSRLNAVSGRLQKVVVEDEFKLPNVFIDYAHTPDALEQVMKAVKKHVASKLWVVFGCGGDRDKGKRSEMGRIAADLADRVVVTSDNPRTENPEMIIEDIMQGAKHHTAVEAIAERHLAISVAIGSCDHDDFVLVAGKGHEDYQIIGTQKLPFSDYLVAQDALNRRRQSLKVAK